MTADYRLLTYRDAAGMVRAGILVEDHVHSAQTLLAGASGIDSSQVMGLLGNWDAAHPRLAEAADKARPDNGIPLAEAVLLAPLIYPSAIFCAFSNYWKPPAKAASGKAVPRPQIKPKTPWFCMKTARHSIVGPGAPVRMPGNVKFLDWEGELGIVIGRRSRNVPVEEAMASVAGYVIVNDLTAVDLSRLEDRTGTPFENDWVSGKCFDDSAPMGPWLTPAAFIPDPADLVIKTWVNGVLKQDYSTGKMVHGIAELIAFLSSRITLRPGDVIATGTPPGISATHGKFLQPGDEVKVEIDLCGALVNRVVAG